MKGRKTGLSDCEITSLPKIVGDRQGSLTYIYRGEHLPFGIKRLYYLYDVPGGAERAGHAHKELQQLIVSVSGSFDVVLDDGRKKKKCHLSRPYYGLYVPRMIWREIINFSSGSVCLALASLPYDESDYIRDYQEFLNLRRDPRPIG